MTVVADANVAVNTTIVEDDEYELLLIFLPFVVVGCRRRRRPCLFVDFVFCFVVCDGMG